MNTLCLILSIISTFLICFFGGLVGSFLDFWIVILLVIGLYVAFVALCLAIAYFVTLPIDTTKPIKNPNKFYRHLFYFVNNFLVFWSGAKIHVLGKEKIEKGKGYLLVFNHRSNFDPMIVSMRFSKNRPCMISKPENIQKPIAGKCIYKAGFLPINRENDREALKTIIQSAKFLADGYSIGICPEGTRNKTGINLLPFKNGVFKIAQKAKAPIAVISVHNTQKIHKNFPFKRTDVYLKVLEVIPAEIVCEKKTNELSDEIFEKIQNDINLFEKNNRN